MSIFKDARLSPLFDTPLYQQVYANLRSSILTGELKRMHSVGWLPAGMDDRSLVQAAASHEVDLVPVANFSMEPMDRKGILLGYSEYTVEQIQDGVRRLAEAMRSV